MNKTSEIALRIVLIVVGAFIVYTGIDMAFGGMKTLGWQVPGAFFQVIEPDTFSVQDSHFRFLAGVWLGLGLLLMLGGSNLERFAPQLKLAFTLIFLGGLARLTQMNPDVLFDPDILGSFVAEILGMPLLFGWLTKVVG